MICVLANRFKRNVESEKDYETKQPNREWEWKNENPVVCKHFLNVSSWQQNKKSENWKTCRRAEAGWPVELMKKSPKMWPDHFFVKISTRLLPCKKVAQNLDYVLFLI
jgi:hypothetical protein